MMLDRYPFLKYLYVSASNQQANWIFPTYIICKKLRKRETKGILHYLVESVQDFSKILQELILLQKKKVKEVLF